jgi:hypothetical protein
VTVKHCRTVIVDTLLNGMDNGHLLGCKRSHTTQIGRCKNCICARERRALSPGLNVRKKWICTRMRPRCRSVLFTSLIFLNKKGAVGASYVPCLWAKPTSSHRHVGRCAASQPARVETRSAARRRPRVPTRPVGFLSIHGCEVWRSHCWHLGLGVVVGAQVTSHGTNVRRWRRRLLREPFQSSAWW